MSSLAQIRTALVATITATLTELSGYDKVPESINTPAVVVLPKTTDFGKAFGRGLDGYTFEALVIVSRADDVLAQTNLDPYVTGAGASSIRQVVWNAKDLGLSDGTEARVTGMTGYGDTFTFGNVDYFGARLTVEVISPGAA
jgi:hypothetical protein